MKLAHVGNYLRFILLISCILGYAGSTWSQSKKQQISELANRADSLLLKLQECAVEQQALNNQLLVANAQVNSFGEEIKQLNAKLNANKARIQAMELELAKSASMSVKESVATIKQEILSSLKQEFSLAAVKGSYANLSTFDIEFEKGKWVNKVGVEKEGVRTVKTYTVSANEQKLIANLKLVKKDDLALELYYGSKMIYEVPYTKYGMFYVVRDTNSYDTLNSFIPHPSYKDLAEDAIFEAGNLYLSLQEDLDLKAPFPKEDWSLFFDRTVLIYYRLSDAAFVVQFSRGCCDSNAFYFR